MQDTYLKAFRSRASFERGTNLRAWLFTILMNTYRNTRRDAARDPVDVDSEVVEGAQAQPGAAATPEELLLRATLGPEFHADARHTFEFLRDRCDRIVFSVQRRLTGS